MLTRLLLTSLLLLTAFGIFAQEEHTLPQNVDTEQNLVISTTGLSLRESPSLSAKRLTVVPYGKTVVILSDRSYGHYKLKEHKFPYQAQEGEPVVETIPVLGQWAKARYRGHTGYVFNGYLIRQSSVRAATNGLNKEVVMMKPGDDCVANAFYRPGWNWYGLYNVNDRWEIRPVTVSLFKSYAEMGEMVTSTQDNKGLYYIIGSAQPLKSARTFDSKHAPEEVYHWEGTSKVNYKNGVWARHHSEFSGELYLQPTPDDQPQRLNPEALKLHHLGQPLWCGDLDGDGKNDYIIYYGEGSSQQVLYLSSYAREGEHVRPVAILFGGYCC